MNQQKRMANLHKVIDSLEKDWKPNEETKKKLEDYACPRYVAVLGYKFSDKEKFFDALAELDDDMMVGMFCTYNKTGERKAWTVVDLDAGKEVDRYGF